MKPTDQTLLEQLRITDFEIEHRKALFAFTANDLDALLQVKPEIEARLDALVAEFYELQTNVSEIALLIGDADTLERLRKAQRKYILDLFSGVYDIGYVNNRLRIGLVHKRIGVEPKLYLAAIHTLQQLLTNLLQVLITDENERLATLSALDKLFMFDISLVFETYIRSMVAEIEASKEKSEQYASSLETKVRERTRQLEEMSRTDPLTGLLNIRHLHEILTRTLHSAQRRAEPVTLAFLDINEFKNINDSKGHQHGDHILRTVATAMSNVAREEDLCFRYGGDEFCVLLPNCSETQAKDIYLQRFYDEIHAHEKNLSLSIGCIQTGPQEYLAPEELLRLADERMYAAKHVHQQQCRPSNPR